MFDDMPVNQSLHPFTGYYLPYPDASYEGLVSTISEDPPMLNWIYIDKDTYQVKYGVRDSAQPHITGPFDWSSQDRRLVLEGWEGFVAVEEDPGIWALYFDRDDNGLKDKVPFGARVLEVELSRREKKIPKPEPEPAEEPMTLDQKFEALQNQNAEQTAGPPNTANSDAIPSLQRLSEILDAYGSTASEGEEAKAAPESPAAGEYITLYKKTPVPGVTIEFGARPNGKKASVGVSSPPRSPTTTATSAAKSMWSTPRRRGTDETATLASSVNGADVTGSQEPRMSSEERSRSRSSRYRQPYVEDEESGPKYVSRWLSSSGSGGGKSRSRSRGRGRGRGRGL